MLRRFYNIGIDEIFMVAKVVALEFVTQVTGQGKILPKK
jgi:hypothetical protein